MIYTFYSYKGGVGRSMALANIAVLFYKVGLKVLMVDWDLEAPGLESYFDLEGVNTKKGLMDMILDYKCPNRQENQGKPIKSPQELVINIFPKKDPEWRLGLITAGKRDGESKNAYMDYANTVRTFDWTEFYNKWDGEFYFDWLRNQFSQMADVILIDTRTGVTEAGGVCNYQIAEVVVMFSTASKQSLEGTHEVVKDLMSSKVKNIRGRELSVIIIPARVESGDKKRIEAFQSDFNEKFSGYTHELIKFTENQLWNLRISYVSKYAYEETNAALEDTKNYDKNVEELDKNVEELDKNVEELINTFRKITFCLSRLAPKESPIRVAFTESWNFTDSGGFLLTNFGNHVVTFEIEKNLGLEVIWLNLSQGAQELAVCLSLFAPQFFEWDIVEEIMIIDSEDFQTKKDQLVLLRDQELVNQKLLIKQEESQYCYDPVIKEFFSAKAKSIEEYPKWQGNFCKIMLAKAEIIGLSVNLMMANIKHIEEAVNIILELFGKKHPTIAYAYNNLAGIYQDMGRYENALNLYKQSLEIKLDLFEATDPLVATAYNNIATLYKIMGRYEDALLLYQQSLEIRLEQLGERHPDVGISFNNLATIYQAMGRYEEALSLYNKALEIGLEQLGGKHTDVATSYDNLANLVATSYNNLAKLYKALGRDVEALPLLEQSLEILLETLGDKHPHVATAYNNLAVIYQEMGRAEEALNLYQQSLDIRLEQLGEKHPDVVTSYNNLAYLYQAMGRYGEAYDFYRKSISIAEESLGSDNPLTQLFLSRYLNMLLNEPEDAILAILPPETHGDFLAVKEKIKIQFVPQIPQTPQTPTNGK
jgi:tetratricopeptide (TPR) repeat protein